MGTAATKDNHTEEMPPKNLFCSPKSAHLKKEDKNTKDGRSLLEFLSVGKYLPKYGFLEGRE